MTVFGEIKQPKNTKLCGQACVASILNISLECAITKIGHRNGTTARDITKALEITGRRKRGAPKIPSLLSVRWGKKRDWHWVLFEGETIMDPSIGYKVDYEIWHSFLTDHGGRITSYLDLSSYKNKP